MRYPQTERQTDLIALATGLADRLRPRAAEHDRDSTVATESFDDLIEAGYHRLTAPRELGGVGVSMIEFVLAQNALGRGDEATAVGINMHLVALANAGLPGAWPEELYGRVVREVVEEGALINSAATEPEMGSPAGGGRPRTTATRCDGGWLINGRKSWTSIVPVLRYLIVLATIDDGSGEAGAEIGQFLVRKGAGIRIEPTWDVMSMRATASDDVVLENAFVPDADVVSRRPLGTRAAPGAINAYFSLGGSSIYLAIAESARDFAVDFARHRAPTGLGRPIGTVQSVQHRIAHMEILLMTARELLFSTAQEWTNFPESRQALAAKVAAAKFTAINNAIAAVDLAMRVVGGAALFRSHPLERYYRNVRAGLNNPPIDDRALDTIARAVLGPLEG